MAIGFGPFTTEGRGKLSPKSVAAVALCPSVLGSQFFALTSLSLVQ